MSRLNFETYVNTVLLRVKNGSKTTFQTKTLHAETSVCGSVNKYLVSIFLYKEDKCNMHQLKVEDSEKSRPLDLSHFFQITSDRTHILKYLFVTKKRNHHTNHILFLNKQLYIAYFIYSCPWHHITKQSQCLYVAKQHAFKEPSKTIVQLQTFCARIQNICNSRIRVRCCAGVLFDYT